MKLILSQIKRFLPWVMTLLVFWYLLRQCPPGKLWEAMTYVNLPLFIGLSVVYFLAVLFLDAWSLAKIFHQFSLPVPLSRLVPARLVSYLMAIVNYFAGQAGLAYFLKKTQKTSFFKNLGTMLLVTLIDLYWVILLAYIGSFFVDLTLHFRWLGTLSLQQAAQWLVAIASIGFFIHLAFWRQWVAKLFRFKIRLRWLDWLRGNHLFQAFHHATVSDYLKIGLLRLPLHLTVIGGYYLSLLPFHLEVPLSKVYSLAPLAILIGTLPLTPGGLGTVQVATVYFFKNEVSSAVFNLQQVRPEQILFAMSLSWMFANYVLKAGLGFIFLKKMGAENFAKEVLQNQLE